MSDDLGAILVELERRRVAGLSVPIDARIAAVRQMLIEAFGEADYEAATADDPAVDGLPQAPD